jgi:hypothetical protein
MSGAILAAARTASFNGIHSELAEVRHRNISPIANWQILPSNLTEQFLQGAWQLRGCNAGLEQVAAI